MNNIYFTIEKLHGGFIVEYSSSDGNVESKRMIVQTLEEVFEIMKSMY